MKKTYQLKTNAFKGEQQVIDVAPAMGKAPVKVQAAAGARYELIDSATKAAPDNIRAMRKGKNLQIFFDGDTEPGAVIENFYQAHTDNLPTLVGRTEQGALYEYIPESAAPSAVVSQLGDTGNAYGMALGGQELAASGAAVGLLAAPLVAGFSPLLLGAGVLGAAALAGGGGSGGGGSSAISATGKLADASDTGTKGDNVTNNTTPTLTGSVPAGSTATVTLNGKTYPITVNSDGTYSYTFTDANKLSDGTYTPVIHVTKNGTTTEINGTPFTIDTKTSVDITNSGAAGTTKAISGTAEAGDTVELKDANGTLIGTTTADSKGQWSLTPVSAIAAGNVTATAKDAAGNTATDTETNLINGGKALGITLDMDANNDGLINLAEKGSATATSVTVSFDNTKVSAGDIITLTEGSATKTMALTAADVAAGKIITTWNLPTTDGSLLTLKATIKDANNTPNNVSPDATDSATLDVTAPVNANLGLKLAIATDADNDGWINFSELGNATTLSSHATFDGTKVKAGDSLVFTATNGTTALDSISHKLTDADITQGFVDVAFGLPANGQAQTVVVNYVDAAGNAAADKVSDTATLDTTVPTNAGVNLALQMTTDGNNDGWVNATELGSAATFTSRASFDKTKVVEGESIVFNATNGTTTLPAVTHKLTATDISNGYVAVTFNKPGDGQLQTVTARYMDKAGNLATDKATVAATLDTTVPSSLGLTIDLDNGKNNTNVDKSYKNDGYINSQEMDTAQTTSLTASFLTAEVAVGDKITFSDGNTANNHTVVLSALDVANGYVTSNGNNGSGWALPANKGIINVTASFIDNAGNTASAEDKAVVDISLASFNALGSVATGGFLQQISFSKPGEAGTYKLHIDNYKITGSNDAPKNYEINGSIDALGNQKNNNWLASNTSFTAKGTDIYLEFWDNAGNYSGKVNLPNSISNDVAFTDKTNFNFNFIV